MIGPSIRDRGCIPSTRGGGHQEEDDRSLLLLFFNMYFHLLGWSCFDNLIFTCGCISSTPIGFFPTLGTF